MEYLGANSEGEWSSLSGMYTAEEADFMAQLLGNCSFPNQTSHSFWHEQDSFLSLSSEPVLEGSYSCSDHNVNLSSVLFPVSGQENYYSNDSQQSFANSSMSMEFCVGGAKNTGYNPVEETSLVETEAITEEKCNDLSENSRKRTRNSSDAQKNSKRNVKAKKNQKVVLPGSNEEEDGKQSSISCSEDDSNGSQETSSKKAQALNSNGKTRASRGSATDPQSLYARKRRERINERLRILQHLVPNGTKVDISTMLEEAVQYVKFLQLQIKLLSSDDMWMYAPIAYNGMDIGLDFKVPTSKGSS